MQLCAIQHRPDAGEGANDVKEDADMLPVDEQMRIITSGAAQIVPEVDLKKKLEAAGAAVSIK